MPCNSYMRGVLVKVRDLSAFTSIWRLSALDKDIRTLVFSPEDQHRVSVSVQGMHIGAERYWSAEDINIKGMTDLVSVDGAMLSGALSLMSENDDLSLSVTGKNLLVQAGRQKAELRLSDIGSRWRMPDEELGAFVVIDRSEIERKLNMLTGVVSRTLDRPALTGINISTTPKGDLIFRATDGHGRACILNHPTKEIGEDRFICTVPAADLADTLDEFGRDVRISLTARRTHLHLADDTTAVRLSLLQGEYPSFQSLPREFAHSMVVPSTLISNAAKAANFLDAARLVTVTKRDSGDFLLVVEDAEKGNYEIDLGQNEVEPFAMHFDSEYLLQVSGAAGIETVFNFTPGVSQAMVKGEGWYYWLTSVVKR